MREKIEYYILQILFFVIYLPVITLLAHFILSAFGVQNKVLHAIVYFSLYGLVCIYNTREFPHISKGGKYAIILVPLFISGVLLCFFRAM